MSKLNFYKYAAVSLLVLNILLVSFFLLRGPGPKPRFKKGNAMEMLNMDENQHNIFLESASSHNNEVSKINKQQKVLLNEYFFQLLEDKPIRKDSLLSLVQNIELDKIKSTFKHLEEIKSILRTEQMPLFENFMTHVLQVVLDEEKKDRRPPKDFK